MYRMPPPHPRGGTMTFITSTYDAQLNTITQLHTFIIYLYIYIYLMSTHLVA